MNEKNLCQIPLKYRKKIIAEKFKLSSEQLQTVSKVAILNEWRITRSNKLKLN